MYLFNNSLKKITFIFSLLHFCLSCQSNKNELYDYEIMSVILNLEFGNESDEENGMYWIDSNKEYDMLRINNCTNLTGFDVEVIQLHMDFRNRSNFPIDDLNKKKKIELEKIKNYNRYELVSSSIKNIKESYIGSVSFSSIHYNENLTEAIVFVHYLCGGDCGFGKIYYLTKKQKWFVKKEEEVYVA